MATGHASRPSRASPAPRRRSALRKLGPPPETSSRSTSSIVAGNVFTLFNAIIGVFFVLDLGLGLYADSIFGLIAVDQLLHRHPPGAEGEGDPGRAGGAGRAARQGRPRRRRGRAAAPSEVVPGDVVAVEPGDQLVADGEAIASRGMTLDESMLTGEADGIRKERRRPGRSPAPSASPAPATTWSTRSARRATPASSPARRAPSATRPRRCRKRSTG